MGIVEANSDRDISCSAFEQWRPDRLKGRQARKLHLNNLLKKLDSGGSTPHKTRERMKAAGYLAAIELQEKAGGLL